MEKQNQPKLFSFCLLLTVGLDHVLILTWHGELAFHIEEYGMRVQGTWSETIEQLAAFLEEILQCEVIYASQTKEQGIKKKRDVR